MVDADIAKDSSTELTVIEKIIDFASNILSARHIPMPESLVIEAMCLNKTTSSKKKNVEILRGIMCLATIIFSSLSGGQYLQGGKESNMCKVECDSCGGWKASNL